jgi:hypothetical protein
MKWISDSELVIDNKVYHITNPEWIKNLFSIMDKENDKDKNDNKFLHPKNTNAD